MAGESLEKKILGEWNDWMEVRHDFHSKEKGHFDSELRLKVGAYYNRLYGRDPNFFIGMPPDGVDSSIREEFDRTQNIVLDYTDKHFVGMLNKIRKENDDRLYSLAMSISPRKTADADHNEIAELHRELLDLQKLYGKDGKNPDLGGMQQYILKKAANEHNKREMAYIMSINPDYILRLFQDHVNAKTIQLQNKFADGKEIDKSKLVSYITGNIKRLKAEEIREGDEDKRDNLKDEKETYYLNIAQSLYQEIK